MVFTGTWYALSKCVHENGPLVESHIKSKVMKKGASSYIIPWEKENSRARI